MCQGLLPSRRHIEKREDPGDEVGKVTGNSEGQGGSKAEISEGSGGFIGSSFSRG